MTPALILEMILISVKLFSEERKRYYDGRVKDLLKIVMQVEDSVYYEKDMEAKGQAERALMLETEELRKEWIKDVVSL